MDGQLTALLHQKLEHLNAIYQLSLAQTDLVQGEDVQPLLDNIQERQEHIDAITQMDEQIQGAGDNCYDKPHEKASERTQQAVYAAMRSVLEKILELDGKNSGAIESRLKNHQASMRAVKQNIRGIQAYSAPVPTSQGLYIDKKN